MISIFVNKKGADIISWTIGGVLVASVIGIPNEIHSVVHTSAIFSISFVCLLVGVLSACCLYRQAVKVTVVDLFVLGCLIGYIGNLSRLNTLWNVGGICLLTLYLVVRLVRGLNYHYVYYSAMMALTILSVWGYLQYFGVTASYHSLFTITGPYHNPGVLGGIMCFLLSIIICGSIPMLSLLHKSKRAFCMVFFVIVFSLPAFIMTYARAAWLALIMAVLYMCYTKYKSVLVGKKIVCLFCLIGCMMTFVCFLYWLKPVSASGRLLIWKVSMQMIKDRPLTGFGRNGFEANYLYYQVDYIQTKASAQEKYVAGNIHHAFNEPIRIAVEHGTVGLILYTLFVLLILRLPTKNSIAAHTAKSLILAIMVWGMFSYPNQVFVMMAMLVLSCAILLKQYSRIAVRNYCRVRVLAWNIRLFFLLLLLLATILLYKHYYLYRDIYVYQKNVRLEEEVKNPAKIRQFHEKLPTDVSVSLFYAYILQKGQAEKELMEVIHFLEKTYPTPSLFIQKGEFLQRTYCFSEAEKAYILASAMVPTKQKARYKLALLYYQIGRKTEAINIAGILLNEKVKNYSFETYEMHQELKKILLLSETDIVQ